MLGGEFTLRLDPSWGLGPISLNLLHVRIVVVDIDRFKNQSEELMEFNAVEEEKRGLSHLYEC